MMHGSKIAVQHIQEETQLNSIKTFLKAFVQLVKGLEGEFQRIREELEFYETDYRTKMIQSK